MRAVLGVVLLLPLVACGGGSPSAPAPPPAPAVITIRVAAQDTLTGASVGTFTTTTTALPARVTVAMPGYLARSTTVNSVAPAVDVLPDGPSFNLLFFRQLARNGLEDPVNLRAIRRLTSSPAFYMRTVTDAGVDVPSATLQLVRTWAPRALTAWTSYTAAGWSEGREDRPLSNGLTVIRFTAGDNDGHCGVALVGALAGEITLTVGNPNCACNGVPVSPRTIVHEVGHTIGLWHIPQTSRATMSSAPLTRAQACNQNYTIDGDEAGYARLMYQRPNGNTDIDNDPAGFSLAGMRNEAAPRIID